MTCARGTEGALRRELVGLRIGSPKGDTGGVWFEGPLRMAMDVCLRARVAVRVLMEVGRWDVRSADELYAGARAVDWSRWLTTKSTLAVHATVRSAASAPRGAAGITHSGFAALKIKDAVVDSLRDKLGARPDVDVKDPDVAIVLHLSEGHAGLFLDLAGEPLHRRGYRVAMTEAPLKETLAAAVLATGGVPVDQPFVDPMGGSGTLAIEQALAARGIAPGALRRFGFERWPTLDAAARAAWTRAREQARAAAAEAPRAPAPIVCADAAPEAVAAARRNAAAAGVEGDVTFQRADAVTTLADLRRRWPSGTVCTNPPYGERLTERDLAGLYRDLAQAMRALSGWTVVLLSGNPLLSHEIRDKPRISHRLWNGPLEVRLLRYEMR